LEFSFLKPSQNQSYSTNQKSDQSQPFLIAQFTIYPDRLLIETNQSAERIEPKIMSVLQFLIQHSEQVVSRQMLIDQVWQGAVVSDNAVNRTITQLRKLLADNPKDPHLIETIAKKGYRFIGQVEYLPATVEADKSQKTPIAKVQNTSLKSSSLIALFATAIILILSLYFFLPSFNNQLSNQTQTESQPAVSSESQTPKILTFKPLTSAPGLEAYSAISNSNQHLAYAYQVPKSDSFNIKIKNLSQSKSIDLTQNEFVNINPAWSSNDEQIAYVRWNNPNERQCTIRLIQLDLSQTTNAVKGDRHLLNCGARTLPFLNWHPKQNAFYYADRERIGSAFAIYKYNTDTGSKIQLSLPPQNSQGHIAVSISPDGQKLAVLNYINENATELLILDESSQKLLDRKQLTKQTYHTYWTTNHSLYLYHANELVLYDINNQQLQHAHTLPQRFRQPRVSRSGQLITATEIISDQNIWQAKILSDQNLANASLAQSRLTQAMLARSVFIQSSQQDYLPRFAHQSNQLVFYSNRSGIRQIWLKDENGIEKPLTDFKSDIDFSPLRWAHNDKYILFKHQGKLWQIELESNLITQRLTGDLNPYNYEYAADNQSLIVNSKKSGDWQLWLIKSSTVDQLQKSTHSPINFEQLTQEGGNGPRLSKDGAYIYYTKYHQNGLWRYSISEKTTTPIVTNFSMLNWLNWQLVDHGAYYLQIDAEIPGVYFYNFDSKNSHLVLAKNPSQSNDFTTSPDQKTIVFSQNDALQGDLYMATLKD
jgi:transcriptional activator of cad operon